ncbi:MAG TPA: hypothetical protein VIV35_06485 [Chitinophagaceae bacterium]
MIINLIDQANTNCEFEKINLRLLITFSVTNQIFLQASLPYTNNNHPGNIFSYQPGRNDLDTITGSILKILEFIPEAIHHFFKFKRNVTIFILANPSLHAF